MAGGVFKQGGRAVILGLLAALLMGSMAAAQVLVTS